ncbi:DUF6301 family protein [Nocardia sp. NPDC051981]|uniref:DUF6301 family protein n=1 Tax=Nocardia sp. NPDC051981 TaxID=3155417 RepID=UPI0034455CE3
MQADLDGAVRIVNAAGAFNWTWADGDLKRFCDQVGWAVIHSGPDGASIETDLEVSVPKAHAFFSHNVIRVLADAGETIEWIVAWVTDIADDEDSDEQDARLIEPDAYLIRAFEQLRDLIGSELGVPLGEEVDEDLRHEITWETGTVVIKLALSTQVVSVSLVNPRYHEWANDGADDDHDE